MNIFAAHPTMSEPRQESAFFRVGLVQNGLGLPPGRTVILPT